MANHLRANEEKGAKQAYMLVYTTVGEKKWGTEKLIDGGTY